MAIMCLRLPREREEKKIAPAMGRPIFATLEKGKKKILRNRDDGRELIGK